MTKDTLSAIQLAVHDWFFVGGEYVEQPEGTFRVGQMHVERFVPLDCRHETPVVMIHGGVQTASNFIATPDGRRGWLHDFLAAGYAVYLVDQPERGRSGHAIEGSDAAKMFRYSAERIESVFTATGNTPLWPQARHHTQWPGTGVRGDPAFDRFFASQVEQLSDRDEIERLTRDACVALLDEIGPAILLTHSQSGPFGWLIADARPNLVEAILAIEPNGPPFRDIQWIDAPTWYAYGDEDARAWGITRLPMTYDPPAATSAELAPQLTPSLSPELAPSFMPSGERRRLVNIAGIRILIVTGEASYHASYDHATSAYLDWADVAHDFIRLEDCGLKGNGHMIMLENNSREVSDVLLKWLAGAA